MARKRDRVFAISVAFLFFISAFGFSFWVIWQAVSNNSSSSPTSTSPTVTCASGTPATISLTPPAAYTPTGPITTLQSTDLTVGKGKATTVGSCLTVKYWGTLVTTGVAFDENYTSKTGFMFKLGAQQVIAGWDQGLIGMKAGGTRRLVIPAALAYGSQSPSASIPANSDLVFVVYLVSFK